MSYQPLNPAGQPAGPVVYAPVVVPGSVVVGGPAVSLLSPPHEWQVELCNTCIESPGSWLYAACCPACSAYDQRVRLLAFTGEPYSCCQQKSLPHPGDCCTAPYQPPPAYPPPMWPPVEGAMPQVMTEFQCELCMEATCCHPCAIGSTRRLMQYKFGVQNSSCDDLTICCVVRRQSSAARREPGCGLCAYFHGCLLLLLLCLFSFSAAARIVVTTLVRPVSLR